MAGRKIIRNGSVELRVDAAASTLRKAEQIVMAHGGFVADQQASYDRGADVTVVYRVPAKDFDSVLHGISGLGTLINARVSSNEVTGQVVDLEARLRSKKVAADRLRILVGQATKSADLLAIEAELANREADIESMSAQLNGLNDQVSLSTIRAHIFTPVTGPVSTPSAKPGFMRGWRGGVDAVRNLGTQLRSRSARFCPFCPLPCCSQPSPCWAAAAGPAPTAPPSRPRSQPRTPSRTQHPRPDTVHLTDLRGTFGGSRYVRRTHNVPRARQRTAKC